MNCLYWTCRNMAMECDSFCAEHRQEFGLYMPQTYMQACAKAKLAHEQTGEKYFVYRHMHENRLHRGYGTSRITYRNWVNAIFSEIIFPRPEDDDLVSTATAQNMMYVILHGGK